MRHISVIEFSKIKNNKETILLDVRTEEEFNYSNIGGIHIPLDQLETRHTELDLSSPVYCLCHHGIRSQHAALFLQSQGNVECVNIEGGIDAYSKLVDSSIPQY